MRLFFARLFFTRSILAWPFFTVAIFARHFFEPFRSAVFVSASQGHHLWRPFIVGSCTRSFFGSFAARRPLAARRSPFSRAVLTVLVGISDCLDVDGAGCHVAIEPACSGENWLRCRSRDGLDYSHFLVPLRVRRTDVRSRPYFGGVDESMLQRGYAVVARSPHAQCRNRLIRHTSATCRAGVATDFLGDAHARSGNRSRDPLPRRVSFADAIGNADAIRGYALYDTKVMHRVECIDLLTSRS
jgi:hypothetical protein